MVQGGNSTEREYYGVAELRALESPSLDSKPDPTTAQLWIFGQFTPFSEPQCLYLSIAVTTFAIIVL